MPQTRLSPRRRFMMSALHFYASFHDYFYMPPPRAAAQVFAAHRQRWRLSAIFPSAPPIDGRMPMSFRLPCKWTRDIFAQYHISDDALDIAFI